MTWPQIYPTNWNLNCTNWMEQLDDDLLLHDLSIPGTHDSAALKGFTHFPVSETQSKTIRMQLDSGIRYLDLRVKRKDNGSGELAMWHGSDFIFDPNKPTSHDQLYFRRVVEDCVTWLVQHPRETIILCVKDEENSWDSFWSGPAKKLGAAVYSTLTQVNQSHQASTNPNYHGMYHGHGVDCKLGQVRGRLVLWRRFACPVAAQDDAQFPGVDLTELSAKYDNTKGATLNAGGTPIVLAQDYYKGTLAEKSQAWLDVANRAFDSRRDHQNADRDLQVLNYVSKAGGNPIDNANILNPLVNAWVRELTKRPSGPTRWPGDPSRSSNPDDYRCRSGLGVIPMDFPDDSTIAAIINMNFTWTYVINAFQSGSDLWNHLVATAGANGSR
jgi:curved DNA-binding protein CbpA